MSNHDPYSAAPPPPRPLAPPSAVGVGPMPTRAAVCGLIPGIGAVYNREYEKAVIHFSVFAGLAYMAESVGIFGLAAFCFYVFTVIDAYRSAESIARRGGVGAAGDDRLNLPVWGGVLVLMGLLFLLDNLGAIHLRSTVKFWPLLLIFLGIYLIVPYFRVGRKGPAERPAATPMGSLSIPGVPPVEPAPPAEPEGGSREERF